MKIQFVPHQPHCFAFGGFEIQMLDLFNTLSEAGTAVNKMDPWSRSLDFDILHLWGLEMSNYDTAYWAKFYKKKVVLTALIGQVPGFAGAVKFKIAEYAGRIKYLKRLLRYVDCLVVVNELEAEKAIRFFRMDKDKVKIIPNMIAKEVVNYIPQQLSPGILPFDKYFFCAGNISERKNQVSLAKAAIAANVNIVFAGNFICSDHYKEEFLNLIKENKNLHYIGELPPASNELLNLFYNCEGFCLPSYSEEQPISILEAAHFDKNIMIGNGGYSKQKLFSNLIKVDPSSVNSISKGLIRLKENADKVVYSIDDNHKALCNYQKVCNDYILVYKFLMNLFE